ncbi:MAG: type III-A CRISPR-associated protein Cas10/Csm1 [Anaerolineaceae bacterium]|nr:type III-A CRISPR-associated protein Cas10/Csm1 [Anaerolineaceae bacterium]
MEDFVFRTALLGLFNNIGSFLSLSENGVPAQPAKAELRVQKFITEYVPEHLQPNQNEKETILKLVNIANGYISGQDKTVQFDGNQNNIKRLKPILTQVDLGTPDTNPKKLEFSVPIAKLDIKTNHCMPISGEDLSEEAGKDQFKQLNQSFLDEISEWKSAEGSNWEKLSSDTYLITILALLRKYLWCVPAPDGSGDASLYEHLRLTSALAACFAHQQSEIPVNEKDPIVLILRGDLSGIQDFIYRITRPESDTDKVTKRLRGRSFYLSLLCDVVVDWILRELGLPPNCALFVGGGRFDLLIPSSQQKKASELVEKMANWFLGDFQGDLSIQTAFTGITKNDFYDMRLVYARLDGLIEVSKQKKWASKLQDENFYTPGGKPWHSCRVCRLVALDEPGICDLCEEQEQIGKHLPHATHLAFCYGNGRININGEKIVHFNNSPFDTRVVIIRSELDIKDLVKSEIPFTLYQLNETDGFIHPGIASSFRFLANTAAKALSTISTNEITAVEKGEVLSFESLAALSKGAHRLGVLRADVDFMGLIISEGLNEDQKNGRHPTITRVATLSSTLDLFFAGYLNCICQSFFDEWQAAQNQSNEPHEWAGSVDGLFYVVYSGGDDLFIVGPWDGILRLAQRLNTEFSQYCGRNPDVTLSAGVVQVKARYPTQKFAKLAGDAEKKSKSKGRCRVTAFDKTMNWCDTEDSFEALLQFSEDLYTEVNQGNINRGLVADLGQLHRQHVYRQNGEMNPMLKPRLFYTLVRRMKPEIRNRIGPKIISAMCSMNVLVPISIVSLLLRKE